MLARQSERMGRLGGAGTRSARTSSSSAPAAFGASQRVCPAYVQQAAQQHRAPAPAAGKRRACSPIITRASAAPAAAAPQQQQPLPEGSVSVLLLAGGVGKRMGAPIPKQYLQLAGQPIATHSLERFAAMPQVGEIVIVCDPSWRHIFEERLGGLPQRVAIKWALPGGERQDSVSNGLQQVKADAAVVAVHDSARPLVTLEDAARCMADGWLVGAAVLGVAVKPTIKEVDPATGMVMRTLQRSKLWEVQTPQCIRPDLLREGFRLVAEKGLEVTDDVSIIEAMGLPVKITPGAYTNIKVTTPEDMSVAEGFLQEQRSKQKEQPQAQAAGAAARAA